MSVDVDKDTDIDIEIEIPCFRFWAMRGTYLKNAFRGTYVAGAFPPSRGVSSNREASAAGEILEIFGFFPKVFSKKGGRG